MAGETTVGSIKYDLDLDDSKFKGKAQAASDDVKSLGDRFSAAEAGSKVFAGGVAIAGAALVGFGLASLGAFNESQRATAQLDAVLKSTKDLTPATKAHAVTVGVSADKHKELAEKLATAKDRLDDLNHTHVKGEDATYKHNKAVKEVTGNISSLEAQLGKTSTVMAGGYTPRVQMAREELIKMAADLQNLTSVSDEAVLGAESMLLTFTNIGKKVFPETTKTVLDMATAMNGGLIPSAEQLRGTAIQLGKAMQDPDAGLGALHRVGVNVEELKKQFNDSMTVEQKQILILKELNTEFGGSAEAAGKTFAGQVELAKQKFNDFQELIGEAIANRLQPLVQAFNQWFNAMGGPQGLLDKFNNEIFPALSANLPIIIGFIAGGLAPALWAAASGMIALFAPLLPFLLIGTAIGLLVQILVEHFGGWEAVMLRLQPIFDLLGSVFRDLILPQLQAVWNQIVTQLLPALQQLWVILEPVLIPVLKFLAIMLGVILLAAIMIFIAGVRLVIGIITVLVEIVSWAVNKVFGFFKWLFDVLVGNSVIPDLVLSIVDWFRRLPGMIISALGSLYDAITRPFRAAFDEVKKMAQEVWNELQKINPFHRQSPSLIDNVTKGMDIIRKEFTSLTDLSFPSFDSMITPNFIGNNLAGAGNSTNQNVNIYVDKVGDMQDVSAIGRELGFRAGIMSR